MERLRGQIDDVDSKMRAMKESIKNLGTDVDSLRMLQGRMAKDQGLDYEDGDNDGD